ncbi:MAG: hypothetical protein EZS28_049405, partial [Streblomastix strix]
LRALVLSVGSIPLPTGRVSSNGRAREYLLFMILQFKTALYASFDGVDVIYGISKMSERIVFMQDWRAFAEEALGFHHVDEFITSKSKNPGLLESS